MTWTGCKECIGLHFSVKVGRELGFGRQGVRAMFIFFGECEEFHMVDVVKPVSTWTARLLRAVGAAPNFELLRAFRNRGRGVVASWLTSRPLV